MRPKVVSSFSSLAICILFFYRKVALLTTRRPWCVVLAARSLTDEVELTPRDLPRLYDDMLGLPFLPTTPLSPRSPPRERGPGSGEGGAARAAGTGKTFAVASERRDGVAGRPVSKVAALVSPAATNPACLSPRGSSGLAPGGVFERGEVSRRLITGSMDSAQAATSGKGRFEFSIMRGGIHYVED